MKCSKCKYELFTQNKAGDKLLRNKAIVFKGDNIVAVCPNCKSDVNLSPEVANKVHRCVVVFFQNR